MCRQVLRRKPRPPLRRTRYWLHLVALYPAFKASLDAALQQSLGQIADSKGKTQGIAIGLAVADRILALRSSDGASAPPIPYIFGTAPGDYQSTRPNFPPQPQLTQWSHVTPFALNRADQFRPGPPPELTSDEYTDFFNEIVSNKMAGMNACILPQNGNHSSRGHEQSAATEQIR